MAQQIQLRHDTAANWTSANPTLMLAEMGIETDTARFKIGDGSTAWASLAYATPLSNPMSAVGDLMIGGTSGAVTRLAGNTTTTKKYLSQTGNGTVSAAEAWSQPAFSEISGTATNAQIPGLSIQSKSANYTVLSTDRLMIGDASGGAFTFTLPTGATGVPLWFKKKDSDTSFNAITITDGTLTTTLNTSGESVCIVYTGSAYEILDRRIPSVETSTTPTVGGFGTVSSHNAFWRRLGDSITVRGTFAAGTTAASAATLGLPGSLAIDTAKLPINTGGTQVGRAAGTTSSTAAFTASGSDAIVFYDGSTSSTVFISQATGSATLTKVNGSTFLATNMVLTYNFSVPISGWKG